MDLTLEEYILKYQGYVNIWANYYWKIIYLNNPEIEIDDLSQAGYLGLTESYYTYNPEKASQSTYAYLSIRYKILDYIKMNSYITHISEAVKNMSNQLLKKRIEFYSIYGREMNRFEILEFITTKFSNISYILDLELVENLLAIQSYHMYDQMLSMEELYDDDNPAEKYDDYHPIHVKDLLASDVNVEEEAIRNIEVKNIFASLQQFPKKEIDIFLETLGFIDEIPKTREKLAEKYHVGHQTIQNKYHKVLNKIRKDCENLE